MKVNFENYGTAQKGDCLALMKALKTGSVDLLCTDPPFKQFDSKRHHFDADYDEKEFVKQAHRVLKKDGMIIVAGRGVPFARLQVMLSEAGFIFKEHFVWNKAYNSSPALAVSRIHEDWAIFAKGKGKIRRVRIPYIQAKRHDIDKIVNDINRLKVALNSPECLNEVLEFFENNRLNYNQTGYGKGLTQTKEIKNPERAVIISNSMVNGMRPNTIIRTDMNKKKSKKSNCLIQGDLHNTNRSVDVAQSMNNGTRPQSIIRTDRKFSEKMSKHDLTLGKGTIHSSNRSVNVAQSMNNGQRPDTIIRTEKEEIAVKLKKPFRRRTQKVCTIIKARRDHYNTKHETQKPVELMEILIKVASDIGDVVLDPFGGSGSTALAAINTGRKFITYEILDHHFDNLCERIENKISENELPPPKQKQKNNVYLDLPKTETKTETKTEIGTLLLWN